MHDMNKVITSNVTSTAILLPKKAIEKHRQREKFADKRNVPSSHCSCSCHRQTQVE